MTPLLKTAPLYCKKYKGAGHCIKSATFLCPGHEYRSLSVFRTQRRQANKLNANGFHSAAYSGVFRRTYSTSALMAKSIESPPECGVLEDLVFRLPSLLPKKTVTLWSKSVEGLSQGNENSLQNKRRNKCTLAEIKTMKCFFSSRKRDCFLWHLTYNTCCVWSTADTSTGYISSCVYDDLSFTNRPFLFFVAKWKVS